MEGLVGRRQIIVLGIVLACGIGYLAWQAAQPPSGADREAAREDLKEAPELLGRGEPEPVERGGSTSETRIALRVCVRREDEPVSAGVLVRLWPAEDPRSRMREARTDAKGIALFEGLEPRDYEVAAFLSGSWLTPEYWPYDVDDPEERLEVDLEPGLPFDGRVLDAVTGAPIRDASVVLDDWGDGIEVGPTDERGAFHVPGIRDESDYQLIARAPGYVATKLEVLADSGRVHPAAPVVRMQPGGALVGVVRSARGEPVAGARVRVAPHVDESYRAPTLEEHIRTFEYGDSAVEPEEEEDILYTSTDADGSFRVDGLVFSATYDVTARAEGHAGSAVVAGVEVRRGRPEASVRVALRRPGRVLLRVALPDGAVLPREARVRVYGEDRCYKPDSRDDDGRFRFVGVDPGLLHGFVEAEGYVCAAVPIQVAQAATVEAEVQLLRGGLVEGSVLGPDGNPVDGVYVRAAPAARNPGFRHGKYLSGGRSTRTDRHGRFEIGGLPAGDVYLVASHGYGEMATRERVRCTPPAYDLRLRLVRRGGYRVRLLEPSGEPFTEGVGSLCTGAFGYVSHGTDHMNGVVHDDGLPAGDYSLLLAPRSYAWSRRRLTICYGEMVDLGDVVLDVGVTVSGQVVDEAGKPVEGAAIRCPASFRRQTRTDAAGRFAMNRFPDGGFSLTVSAVAHAYEIVDVRPGATTGLRIVLHPTAHLTGRVKSLDGGKVTEVSIELRPLGAKTTTYDEGVPVERYVGAHWLWAGVDGRFDEWVRPGTYVGLWEDEQGREHRLGEWTFEPTETYELDLVLPSSK